MTTDTDTLRNPFRLMQEFYLSEHYDPNAKRPADNVQAAIAFALATLSKPEPAAAGERPAVPAKNGFLSFWYKNYRGELSERVAIPIRIYHGATEWHPEPQWLLEAWDMEKDAVRAFAMSDMQAPPPSSEAISPPDALERFTDDVQDVHSRIVIVHQLRASAAIQDRQTKRETGWADTSDRASLMRKDADTIEALTTASPLDARAVVEADVERVARAISIAMRGYDSLPNDMSLPYAEGSPVGKAMSAARAAIAALQSGASE